MTSQIATREAAAQSPFGAILREAITEMEASESTVVALDDIVQRLSLAAHYAISLDSGRPLPRLGGYAYQKGTVTPLALTRSQLDVRF